MLCITKRKTSLPATVSRALHCRLCQEVNIRYAALMHRTGLLALTILGTLQHLMLGTPVDALLDVGSPCVSSVCARALELEETAIMRVCTLEQASG